ncbi:hypothetical protein [Demetria terragena]|uniref:hypothetical protein n=1 Tax=Demetria terragena TaxID=63959 RepID=UPI0003772334|nr:hypothetical protein [Demetria terragena]
MPAPEPPPLNDLEHLLAGALTTPHDPALMHRFNRLLLDAQVGVAGRLHETHEFTPLLVGSTEQHHVVAFTHPARFDRFRSAVQVDSTVQTQPLTGRDTFERLVASAIPLLINPQCHHSVEIKVGQMSALLHGMGPGDASAPTAAQQITEPTNFAPPTPLSTPAAAAMNPQQSSFAPPPQAPAHVPTQAPAGPFVLGPPQYVPVGLYERLTHYFNWLGAIDEAALLWCRWPNGGEGFVLKIRTQMAPPQVLANINQPIGDLQGQYLDIQVDGWHVPPWQDGVAPFYARRR